jgi:hypothetical protein
MTQPLTPAGFDRLTARPGRIIWTLPAIGRRLGRGRDVAASLAKMPGSPIRKIGRQYFVEESRLMDFLAGDAG